MSVNQKYISSTSFKYVGTGQRSWYSDLLPAARFGARTPVVTSFSVPVKTSNRGVAFTNHPLSSADVKVLSYN